MSTPPASTHSPDITRKVALTSVAHGLITVFSIPFSGLAPIFFVFALIVGACGSLCAATAVISSIIKVGRQQVSVRRGVVDLVLAVLGGTMSFSVWGLILFVISWFAEMD